MKRGDFVSIAMQGDFGKPRPALIIQAEEFNQLSSITILPLTITLINASLLRIDIEPSLYNGLEEHSQVMIDKITTIKKDKIGKILGYATHETMLQIERCLAVFLGIV